MGADFANLAPDEQWRRALEAAPRELFIPDIAWTTRDGLIDRHAERDTWTAAVARDGAIVTQIDDGHTELTAEAPWRARAWTSSCSAPNMVLDFLRLLDPYDGDRVLEIGTGTGWTAALLSARLGARKVTSIEVDEQVAKQAADHLERAGFCPNLVVGNGAEGWVEGAPYDRVHVTCGVREVPYAWVAQTRPGGVIALPWIHKGNGTGLKTKLTVTVEAAVGRFHGPAAYMVLRSQRPHLLPIRAEPRESVARVDPRRIGCAGVGLQVAVTAMLPGAAVDGGDHPDGSYRLVVEHLPSDSHAIAVRPPEGGQAEVRQRGPRGLWEELEAAYLMWVGWGEPGVDRFGLIVDREGQQVWLDSPTNRIAEVQI